MCISYGSWLFVEIQFLIDLPLYPLSLFGATASLLSRMLHDPVIPPDQGNLMPEESRLKQQGQVWKQEVLYEPLSFR